MDTIGKRIRYARKMNHLSLVNVKERTGISTGNLSELENDKFSPSSNTLIAFKRLFNISIDWLLTGEPPMTVLNTQMFQEDPSQYLSDAERELIENYQTLDEEKRRDIIGFIHVVTANSSLDK